MESFYKQTTIVYTELPAVFLHKSNSFKTTHKVHYQITLRVAEDANLIEEKWRQQFYKYFAGCVSICGGTVETIGVAADCVHLLITLRSTKAFAEFLRELKLLSQTWARRKMQISGFAWQDKVEVFTVSAMQLEQVKARIQRKNAPYWQYNSVQQEKERELQLI